MPPKKTATSKVTSSPYFKDTPVRKSPRVSAASSANKRRPASLDSDFDDGESSESDFEDSRNRKKQKIGKQDENFEVDNDESSTHEDDQSDSDDESKPPKTVIIPLPVARDEGDTPYEDGRIHTNTMLFLADLKANNNREWMRFNDEDFRTSQKDFASYIEELTPLVAEKDFTIPELPNKDIIFRIYRDVRFSNDPTPYKPHFSAAWSRTGKKGPYAAYYLHVQPGQSFIGGGLWHPEGTSLERLREDIDQRAHRLKRVLMAPDLRRNFFKGAKDEKSVLENFLKLNAENALKTKPRGYGVDHKDIKLLRLRNFTISRKLDDAVITSEDSLEQISEIIQSMVPFITYLNSVVRPDRNAADSSDSSDGEGDDQDDDEE